MMTQSEWLRALADLATQKGLVIVSAEPGREVRFVWRPAVERNKYMASEVSAEGAYVLDFLRALPDREPG